MAIYQTISGQIPLNIVQNVHQLANSTSEFRIIDIKSLNVEFYNATTSDEISSINISECIKNVPQEVYVSNADVITIKECINDYSCINKFEKKSKTFVQLMNYVLENETVVSGTNESRTDAFVNHILEKLEFGEYPLMIQPQPLYQFKVHTKIISSKYDFAVIKDKHVMLVDEDKHISNTGPSYAWGEYQIAGELIAGAYYNYNRTPRKYKNIIHAVRVIGLKFTFYKAEISHYYLDELGIGLPKENKIAILRYPSTDNNKDFSYLDYCNPEERKKIVELLVKMREELINSP